MVHDASIAVFLRKADECLAGAESEFANNRFHNAANRCYYACFLGAVYALRWAGTQPVGSTDAWSHAFVQAQFASQLIGRLKRYPTEIRDTLSRTFILRRTADYTVDEISQTQASRALVRVRAFLAAIHREGIEQYGQAT
jgi:uncharacterized protein (UPF0332 family)